jgi:hypothetical protein
LRLLQGAFFGVLNFIVPEFTRATRNCRARGTAGKLFCLTWLPLRFASPDLARGLDQSLPQQASLATIALPGDAQ